MTTHPRPLSPHLQVYKPQLTSVLSILHRGTGIALAVGSGIFAAWLLAIAQGPEALACFQSYAGSLLGRLCGLGWLFSLYYHLCNGLRHLAWDIGWGFSLKATYASGWTVVIVSIALTGVTVLGFMQDLFQGASL
jgi:succinate dehydrogenase / fumarate reductase cytochrome b subunit